MKIKILVMRVDAEWSADLKWSSKVRSVKNKKENFLLVFKIVLVFSMGSFPFCDLQKCFGRFFDLKKCYNVFLSKYIKNVKDSFI